METLDDLTAEFKAWCERNDLPWVDAYELLMCHELNVAQYTYLQGFVARWDACWEFTLAAELEVAA